MGSEFQSQPRVLVIGAGVVGASIAWHLATSHPDGANVTIVAEEMGGVATPCSFAWLNASYHNARFYYDFRRRSMAGWKRLADRVPELGKLVQWCGSLGWNLSPKDLEEYQTHHSAWGYDIRRIERAEIQQIEPALTPEGGFIPAWAVHVREEGMVEPAEAARLMVTDAQRQGARLVTGKVTRLLQELDGRVTGLVLSSGEELRADHVVVAAGVQSAVLCATAGVTIPLRSPAPAGLLVRSKPIEKRILNHIVCSNRGHMRQTAAGYILAGRDFVGGDPGADPEAAARKQLDMVKTNLRPEYAELLEFDRFTVGYRPQPTDGLPIIGASGLPGLDVAVMHSGVTNAALVGELLAEKILTGREDASLKDFSLKRFSNEAL